MKVPNWMAIAVILALVAGFACWFIADYAENSTPWAWAAGGLIGGFVLVAIIGNARQAKKR